MLRRSRRGRWRRGESRTMLLWDKKETDLKVQLFMLPGKTDWALVFRPDTLSLHLLLRCTLCTVELNLQTREIPYGYDSIQFCPGLLFSWLELAETDGVLTVLSLGHHQCGKTAQLTVPWFCQGENDYKQIQKPIIKQVSPSNTSVWTQDEHVLAIYCAPYQLNHRGFSLMMSCYVPVGACNHILQKLVFVCAITRHTVTNVAV